MHALLFANGELTPHTRIPPADFVIAADGGARHALSLGIEPTLVIGDFDSLSEIEIDGLRQKNIELRQFPPEKDETDLELALRAALDKGATHITLVGLLGGRWDMSLANLLTLAAPQFAALTCTVLVGDTTLHILNGGSSLTLTGTPGDTVSAIPLTPTAGITYEGLAYPLTDAALPFGTPRGVSNEMITSEAAIHLKTGVLLVTHTPSPTLPKEIE